MNLCELINTIKEKEGLTWRQLTERARQKGAPVPTGLFHLGNPDRPMQDFPRTKTIHGIAAALDVDPEVVAAAALESLGLQPPDVVRITAKDLAVITDGQGHEPSLGHPGEHWIVITPDDQTPEAVLRKCRTAGEVRVTVAPRDEPPHSNPTS